MGFCVLALRSCAATFGLVNIEEPPPPASLMEDGVVAARVAPVLFRRVGEEGLSEMTSCRHWIPK